MNKETISMLLSIWIEKSFSFRERAIEAGFSHEDVTWFLNHDDSPINQR